MFGATLFDYNGVLVDDERVHLVAFQQVLAPLGIELSEQAYWDEYLGYDDRGAFEAVLRAAGQRPDANQVNALIAAKRPKYLALAEHQLRFFDGAKALVAARAAAGPVLVVSGALRDEIELGLERLGVRDRVRSIIAAEDTERSKPDPQGYELGIAQLARAGLGNARRETIVIEDSISGVEAAKAASLCCVAVTHSYPREALAAVGADAIVDTLSEVDSPLLAELYASRA